LSRSSNVSASPSIPPSRNRSLSITKAGSSADFSASSSLPSAQRKPKLCDSDIYHRRLHHHHHHHLLGYSVAQSSKSQPTFRRNMLPPSSEMKGNQSLLPVHAGFFLDLLLDSSPLRCQLTSTRSHSFISQNKELFIPYCCQDFTSVMFLIFTIFPS
jgi:hypothetical protein